MIFNKYVKEEKPLEQEKAIVQKIIEKRGENKENVLKGLSMFLSLAFILSFSGIFIFIEETRLYALIYTIELNVIVLYLLILSYYYSKKLDKELYDFSSIKMKVRKIDYTEHFK